MKIHFKSRLSKVFIFIFIFKKGPACRPLALYSYGYNLKIIICLYSNENIQWRDFLKQILTIDSFIPILVRSSINLLSDIWFPMGILLFIWVSACCLMGQIHE